MVKFRCKRSGNFVSFSNEDDINHMRKHEGYEEIKDEIQIKETSTDANEKTNADETHEEVLKRRGRPRKEPAMEI